MKSVASNPLPYLLRKAWEHAGDQRGRFVLYVVMSMAAMAVYSLEPLVIGRLLNLLQSAGSLHSVLQLAIHYLLLYGGLSLFFWMLHGPSRVIERGVAFAIRTQYQIRLLQMTTSLPLQWHKDNHSGEIIDKVNRASSALNEFMDGSFEVIHILTRFIGSVAILCFFMPYAGLGVLVTTAVVIGVTILFDRVLFEQDQKLNAFYQKTAAAVHDYISNVTTVISLRLEGRAVGEVLRRIQMALPTFRQNIILNEWKWFVTSMLVSGVITSTLIIYLISIDHRNMAFEAGTFFSLFEYLRRIGDGFFGFAWKYGNLVTHASKLKSAEVIALDYDQLVSPSASATLPSDWRVLEVHRLWFTYLDEERPGVEFNDLSLRLERGQSIALVGESGSGKSTLLSLLRMLRTPRSVEVLCDGRRLPHGLHHVAHRSTLIPQDPEIFADTIRFNISMGVEATEEQLLDMLRMSRFESVLARLPRGLDSNIAEKAVNLSGGEKQRLALARGLFFAQGSDIILLDEFTSSVDSVNERAIYDGLLKQFEDRCVIAAIHKLHLLPLFDYIYVFSKGRIVEQGTYAELVQKEGVLAGLMDHYTIQSNQSDCRE